MTTKEIQDIVCKHQVLKFHNPVCENITPLVFFRWEMDVMSVSKTGLMFEFEVKISRSDFKADKKKKKFYNSHIQEKSPNFFSYVCPEGLIKPEEIESAYAGLYYVIDERLIEIKKPKKIHSLKHDLLPVMIKASRVMSERKYLGCCRMTYENKKILERYNERENKNTLHERLFN